MRVFALLLVTGLFFAPAFADDAPYLAPGQIDVLSLLPPAPAANSAQAKRDLDAVLRVQRARGPADVRAASADAEPSLSRFAPVLGLNFTADKLPFTFKLLTEISRERGSFSNLLKDCYKRARPFVATAAVHPLPEPKTSALNDPKRVPPTLPVGTNAVCAPEPASPPAYSYSYPSGHASFGALMAIELSGMVPEKRAELFARGWDIGWSRVLGGVHYPSDLEAGRILAELIADELTENARFRADFAAARAELRAALAMSP
jgi:acid phosphatase (class A)